MTVQAGYASNGKRVLSGADVDSGAVTPNAGDYIIRDNGVFKADGSGGTTQTNSKVNSNNYKGEYYKAATSTGTSGSTGGTSTPYSAAAKSTNTPPGFASNGSKMWKVGADGKAPSGAKPDDYVVTADGTYKIGKDGKGVLVNKDVTTANYKGGYYTPPASAGTGSSAGTNTYNIGTLDGSNLYDYVMRTGQGVKLTDGAYLSKGDDGKIYAFHNGVKMPVANNYAKTPQEAAGSGDATALAAALAALWQNPNSDYLAYLKKANNAAVNKAVSSLEAQKKSADQSFADIFRRLYINKMLGQKNMDQQLAAQGITGGMAETTRLGYDTQYADALRQGEIERLNTLAGLNQAITDTRYNGDISYAQAAAQEAQQRQTNYANVLAQLLTRQDNRDAQAQSQSNWERQFAEAIRQANLTQQNTDTARQDNLDATNRNAAYQTALAALQEGQMVSDEALAAAGIDKTVAQAIVQGALEQRAEARRSGISQAQAQTAVAAAIAGQRTDAVRQIIEGYYGLPMETVLAAYV